MRTRTIIAACCIAGGVAAQSGTVEGDMLAGMAALRAADHGTAERSFSHAVARDPEHAKAWYYRGVSRLSAGDAEGAVEDLGRVLRLTPGDANALIRHAEACLVLNWRDMARQDLEQVLALRGDGPAAEHALLLLGKLAFSAGDMLGAKARYDRLIAIAPYNTLGLVDRGIVLLAMGQPELAIVDLEQALELDPDLGEAYGQLALAHHQLGHRMEACAAWQLALNAGDHSVEESILVFCD
jgi:tetratricopeptide (TPR) repeat protein